MKTMQLVMGLIAVLGAVCAYAVGAFGTDVLVLKGLWFVGGMVQSVLGVNRVMDALFGDDGLVCEVFGRVEDEE